MPATAYEMATVPVAIQIPLTWCIIHEEVITQAETRSVKTDQNSAKKKKKNPSSLYLLWLLLGYTGNTKGKLSPGVTDGMPDTVQ